MISNPSAGWCQFTIEDFEGLASYTTDVPCNLLDCFIQYMKTNCGCSYLDEEGTEFTFVLSDCEAFIIRHEPQEKPLYQFKATPIQLAQELINDLTSNVDDWICNFYLESDNANFATTKKNEILDKLGELRHFAYRT